MSYELYTGLVWRARRSIQLNRGCVSGKTVGVQPSNPIEYPPSAARTLSRETPPKRSPTVSAGSRPVSHREHEVTRSHPVLRDSRGSWICTRFRVVSGGCSADRTALCPRSYWETCRERPCFHLWSTERTGTAVGETQPRTRRGRSPPQPRAHLLCTPAVDDGSLASTKAD